MLPKKFWDKVKISTTNFYNNIPCWEWTSTKDSGGYGQFRLNGKRKQTHRVAYEEKYGKIPKGLQLDHLCRNRKCCNSFHLEAVTPKENIRRGLSGKINNHQSNKTHCIQGHEFTSENTYIRPNGRECRTCHRIREHQQRKKLELI